MIVGVDVSSRRIDLAWLENGKPRRWHQELGKGHLIDRLRAVDIAWPGRGFYVPASGITMVHQDVTDVAIEAPFSTSRRSTAALSAVVGIVTRQAPPWARVAWPSAGELRAAIGAKNTKDDAHICIRCECGYAVWDWDEHELDALTACIGWTRILEQQEGAA